MITAEQELKTTQDRIERFQQWLAQIRRTARPDEFRRPRAAIGLKLNACRPK